MPGACGGDDAEGARLETADAAPAEDGADDATRDDAAADGREVDADDEMDAVDTVEAADTVADSAADDTSADAEAVAVDCGDCDDGLECTSDVCGPVGLCSHNVKAGMCKVAGQCVASGHGPDPCRICAPDVNPNGLTSLTGGPCDDGDPCTTGEQCTVGSCTGGIVRECPASSACYVSLGCDKVAGCMEEPLADGTPCGSGLACEGAECIVGDGMPTGTVAWFDALRCPEGWDRFDAATGRTLVPVGPAGPIGGVIEGGTPLTSGADPAHTHAAAGTVVVASQRFVGVAGGGNALAEPGTIAVSGSLAPASLGLPYVQLLACRKTSEELLGRAPAGVFAFAAEACASGWTASDEGSDRLVVGVPAGGSAGATFGAPPGLATPPSHTHGVSGPFTIASHGIALASGCCSTDFASSADPEVSLVSGPPAEATSFPWRAELQCFMPSDALASDADTAPPGIVLFASESACPPGWVELESARGRLIVGAATGGDVGLTVGAPLGDREDRVHAHAVTLGLTLVRKNIAALDGPNNDGAAPGAHATQLTSAPATSGLPFRQLLACRKP